MTETVLDQAHAAMEASGDDAARLRFFERLADAELFVLLATEPEGEEIALETFDLDIGSVALSFDRETRLTDFIGSSAPYAALSGRNLTTLLAEQGLGLGLNLDVAPSAMLLPPDAVVWLAELLSGWPT